MAGANDVQIRLRMLGAAVFSSDVRRASADINRIANASRNAGGGLRRVDVAARRTQASLKRVERAASAVHDSLEPVAAVLGGVGVALGGAFVLGVKQSAEFEQKMANVQGKLLTTGANMERLSRQALQLGGDTSFSASEVADAMNELAAQGFTTRQIMQTIPGTLSLAAASGADLAQSAAIQTETLHAFGLQAKQASTIADVLAQVSNRTAVDIDDLQESLKYIAPVAKATGQSLTDVGAAVGLMGNVGIKGSQSGTTLRTAMVRLTAPTEKARGALADLGIHAKDLQGPKGLKPLPKILEMFARGSQGVSKNTRNAAIAAIFGREALSGMVALIEKGPAKLRKLSDALENSRGAAKRAADIQRNTVKGAFDQLTGSLETASIKLTRRFNPALRTGLRRAANGIGTITDLADAFQSGFAGDDDRSRAPRRAPARVDGMGSRRANPSRELSAGAAAGQKARQVAEQVLGFITDTVVPAVRDFIPQVIDAVRPALPFFQNVVLPLLEGFGAGVLSTVKIIASFVKPVATVLGAIGNAAKPLKGVFQAVGYVLGGVFGPGLILKVGRFLTTVRFLGPVLRLALLPFRLLRLGAVGLGRGLSIVGGRVMQVLRFVGMIGGKIAGGIRFLNAFRSTWTSVAGRILGTVIRLANGVVDAIAKIGPGILKFVSRFFDAGKTLGRGLFNGLKAIFTSGAGFVADLGRSLANAVIGLLNSAIPNKIPVPGAPDIPLPDNPIPTLATGGKVKQAGWAIVGERGPELRHLGAGDTVYDAQQTARLPEYLRDAPSRTLTAVEPARAAARGLPDKLHVTLVAADGGRALAHGVARFEDAEEAKRG